MMQILVFILGITAVRAGSFICPSPNGQAENTDDSRSYYVCTDSCDRLEYCSSSTAYYASIDGKCKEDSATWTPEFDLTGIQEITPVLQYRHFRQSGYNLYWSSETKTHNFAFVGRYINENQVVGTETILSLKNKCVLIIDVQLSVKATKSFCATNVLNPYSPTCATPDDYIFSGCVTY